MPELKPGRRVGGAFADGWTRRLTDYPRALAWRSDGLAVFTADAAGELHCFDARSGESVWRHQAHDGGVLALAVSPVMPVLATAGEDGCGRLWRLDDGGELAAMTTMDPWSAHLAWSPDGTRVALASGRRASIHGLDGAMLAPPCEHDGTISGLAWLKEGRLCTARYGGTCEWDAMTGACIIDHAWRGAPTTLAISPDENIIACGGQDASIHFWRRRAGNDAEMRGYATKPTALAFDRSSQWLASNGGEDVTVWSFAPGGPEGSTPLTLRLHTSNVSCLAFSPRHELLASGARDGSLCAWQFGVARQGRLVGAAVTDDAIVDLAWRPDGRGLASLGRDGAIRVWRVRPDHSLELPVTAGRAG